MTSENKAWPLFGRYVKENRVSRDISRTIFIQQMIKIN